MVAELQQQSYRLKVRVGDAEFEADGPEETVKSQFDLFLMALKYSSGGKGGESGNGTDKHEDDKSKPGSGNNSSIEQQTWDRFYMLEGDTDVSLKVLPTSDSQNADSLLLLLYGYLCLRQVDAVGGTDLLNMAKKSGLRIDRIDRNIPTSHSRYISRGGRSRGARYALNNQGRAYAQQLLEAEAER